MADGPTAADGLVSTGPTLAYGAAGGEDVELAGEPLPGAPAGQGSITLPRGSPDTNDAMIGRILGQNYRVVEQIGAGGMGIVYVVEHVTLKKRFAAKVLSADLARHPEALARFEVEAHSASQLDHDNIVTVIDYGHTDDGTVFLIMELLRGESLQDRMRRAAISLEEVISIMVPVCHALGAAHAAGIIHRDMKPDNVFLTERGLARPVVKVLDFGISKVNDSHLKDARITKQGQVLGSPEYMSPEAARGDEVDTRADVYAMGVMLYELVCGVVPFHSPNYLKVLQKHVNDPPRPPREHRPDLPESLERVILRAMEKDVAGRYQSVYELERDLLEAVPDVAERALFVPAHTPPGGFQRNPSGARHAPSGGLRAPSGGIDSGVQPAAEPIPRSRLRTYLAVLVAVVAVAAGVAVVLPLARTGSNPPPETARPADVPAAGSAFPDQADEQAREPAAPSPPAEAAAQIRLRIASSPPQATVVVDGKLLGQTPLDVDIAATSHPSTVEITREGFRAESRRLVLDRDAQLDISLQPIAERGKRAAGRRAHKRKPADETGSSRESLEIKITR
jgi:eukaryotic-like serine/threonine-protein kinase